MLKSEFPHVRLLLVGEGPERHALEALAADRGIADAVRFTGRRDDVPAMLAGMDAFVCSSDSECMSNAILEAMAAGLPIVATSVGENARVIRNAIDGITIQPGSDLEMAKALRTLIGDPDLRRRVAASAAARAYAFDFRLTVMNYKQFYTSLVDGRPASAPQHGLPDSVGQPVPQHDPPMTRDPEFVAG